MATESLVTRMCRLETPTSRMYFFLYLCFNLDCISFQLICLDVSLNNLYIETTSLAETHRYTPKCHKSPTLLSTSATVYNYV